MERALRHLPKASKQLEKDLQEFGTGEQRQIGQAIDDLEDEIQTLEEELKQSRKNAAALKDEKEALERRLLATAEVRSLQQQRHSLEVQRDTSEADLREATAELESVIRERGFLAFAGEALERVRHDLAERRKKGEIPTPIKKEFITDLLAKGTCICGSDLSPGSRGYVEICGWRERAGLVELDDAWHALFAEAGRFLEERKALQGTIAAVLRRRARARDSIRSLEEQISELSQRIGASGVEAAEMLEQARAAAEAKLENEQRRTGSIENQLRERAALLSTKRAALRRAEGESAQAELARRRVSLAQDAVQALQTIFDLRVDEVRRTLDARIKQVYGEITYKTHVPRLDEEFALKLSYDREGLSPVPKSTGENQILSLAFVGALAALARERYEHSRKNRSLSLLAGAMGGIFPIVMDAAFGTLDENYRADIARGLPKLAPQVIVMVSKAQGRGPVEDELRSRIDRSYVIHFRTTKSDIQSESLEVAGRSYPYIDIAVDGIDQAEIRSLR